ncbi:MAG TPA: alpha/beta hydrolase, partial [Candidatus Limnocylindrales bacterium]|nr:alpha/beta hydrolase [Candidatus Limnocylindrales bacterium]
LVLGYVLAEPRRPRPDVAVASAPAIASSTPGWQRIVAAALDRVAPRFTLMDAFDGDLLSRDPAIGASYATDPLAFHGTTVRLGAEALRQQRAVRAAAAGVGRLDLPVLVYHGEGDRIVPVAATAPLASIAGVTRRTYPHLRHESHNEPEGEAVIADVVAWLRSVLQSDHN